MFAMVVAPTLPWGLERLAWNVTERKRFRHRRCNSRKCITRLGQHMRSDVLCSTLYEFLGGAGSSGGFVFCSVWSR